MHFGRAPVAGASAKDAGQLAAAAGRPRVTVFGDDAVRRFRTRPPLLLDSLVRNHALVDGNKRPAWSATRIFSANTSSTPSTKPRT